MIFYMLVDQSCHEDNYKLYSSMEDAQKARQKVLRTKGRGWESYYHVRAIELVK
jgi:hypothetical protein